MVGILHAYILQHKAVPLCEPQDIKIVIVRKHEIGFTSRKVLEDS